MQHSTDLQTTRPSQEWVWTEEQQRIIREQFADGCSDDELLVLLYQAKRRRLDPMLGQIRGIKRWNEQKQRKVLTIQTSIDAFRLIAQRTGTYGGGPAPVFRVEEVPAGNDEDGNPKTRRELIAQVTVRKLCGNAEAGWTWMEVTDEARWSEYVQTKQNGQPVRMWQQMPHNQLAKCAEAKTLRRGWPEDLGALYTDDEMGQADNPTGNHEHPGRGPDRPEGSPDQPQRPQAEAVRPPAEDNAAGEPSVEEPRHPLANAVPDPEEPDCAERQVPKPEPIETRHTPDTHQNSRLAAALLTARREGCPEDKLADWMKRAEAAPTARAFDQVCKELEDIVARNRGELGPDGLPLGPTKQEGVRDGNDQDEQG